MNNPTAHRDERLGRISRNEVEVYFYALCIGVPTGLQWKADDADSQYGGHSAQIGPLVLGVYDASEPERLITRWAWHVSRAVRPDDYDDYDNDYGEEYVYSWAPTLQEAKAAALAVVPECMVLAVADCLWMVPRG